MELKWKADLIDDRISHFSLSSSTQWHCSGKKFRINSCEERYNLIKASKITILCKFYDKISTTKYISITGNFPGKPPTGDWPVSGELCKFISLDVTVLAGVCLMVTVIRPGQQTGARDKDIAPYWFRNKIWSLTWGHQM